MNTSIITGDIINSRNSELPEKWLKVLKETLNRYGKEPKTWEIYRGDSFQLEVSDPVESLNAALLIKASIKEIKNLDVRIAIGIGEKTYSADRITESNGPVFINSGTCFESLKLKTLAIKTEWPEIDSLINLLLDLASLTMNNWSPTTARNIRGVILNPGVTQKRLAEILQVKSQSTISESFTRGGYEEMIRLEKYYRNLIKSVL